MVTYGSKVKCIEDRPNPAFHDADTNKRMEDDEATLVRSPISLPLSVTFYYAHKSEVYVVLRLLYVKPNSLASCTLPT